MWSFRFVICEAIGKYLRSLKLLILFCCTSAHTSAQWTEQCTHLCTMHCAQYFAAECTQCTVDKCTPQLKAAFYVKPLATLILGWKLQFDTWDVFCWKKCWYLGKTAMLILGMFFFGRNVNTWGRNCNVDTWDVAMMRWHPLPLYRLLRPNEREERFKD